MKLDKQKQKLLRKNFGLVSEIEWGNKPQR